MSTVMNVSHTNVLQGTHKGKRGVLLGAGWSLSETNLELFKDDIIFACNLATTYIEKCDYFCMTDGADPESNFFEHSCSISKKNLFMDEDLRKSPGIKKLWDKIESKSLFFSRRSDRDNYKFHSDDGKLIRGYDIGHVMAHIAYLTGCDPIVLVGFDLNYKNNKKYCDSKMGEIKWSETQGYGSNLFYSKLGDGGDDKNLINAYAAWIKVKNQNTHINFFITNPKSRLIDHFTLL